ncbi:MAG: SURF1 family protein [Paracoccaceae bacterium]
MIRQMIGPLIVGVLGVATLMSLGIWQLQRLAWKQAILDEIGVRISAPAEPIAEAVDAARDKYQPVQETGVIGGREIHVLASRKQKGAGYRVIVPFAIGERVVLLDRGFLAIEAKDVPRPQKEISVFGNLHWPDEIDSYTPPPDLKAEIWFARDIEAMAAALEAEPVLIIARSDTGDEIEPHPVAVSGIPNDHLQYAITWFSLAVVWFGMTGFLLWRMKRRTL